jgi:acetyl-CoA C-acetyltransferase/acetyl-CoA acyltransferase
MAPARAIPQLLARHRLKLSDIDLWEIHEAFAAQVLANVRLASDPAYRVAHAKVDVDLGAFPWDQVNPNGGSLAIGHPFAATGARILAVLAKLLASDPRARRGLASACTAGGMAVTAILERA